MLLDQIGTQAQYENLRERGQGPFTLPVPGTDRFVDADRFNSFAGAIDTATTLGNLVQGEPLPENTMRHIVPRPLIAPAILSALNQQALADNPDRPRPISNPGAPGFASPRFPFLPGLDDRTGAHIDELAKSYLRFLLGGRGSQAITQSALGRTPTDFQDATPKPLADALAQYLAGLRLVEPQSRAEQHTENRPAMPERFYVANEYYRQVRDETKANPDQNPFSCRVAKLSADEADAQANDTSKYIQRSALQWAGRRCEWEAHGDGKRRLRNGILYFQALTRRARAAGKEKE